VDTKRRAITSFLDWVNRKKLPVADFAECHLTAFLRRPALRRWKHRLPPERAALRGFLDHLRGEAARAPLKAGSAPRSRAALEIEDRYVNYLRNERGLSERSVEIYVPRVREFIGAWEAALGELSPPALKAQFVRDFLLNRVRSKDQAFESVRLLAAALRSLMHFLFLRGATAQDLALAVPTVRRWSLARVPSFLSPDEVERVVTTADRTTVRGRRDYAILLLLARLGLRAGEVVALEIGDICWRTAEFVVRGKGRILARLPLLADVGEALAQHLQDDRRCSTSRRVFLRKIGTSVGLTGPAAIGHVVRAALTKAGLRSARRGAAHLLRRSLATRMIRQGASLAQISEVLRHGSPVTTQLYAKVDFETLRGVARAWPDAGSTR
jgi:site-specific recombinase XerD